MSHGHEFLEGTSLRAVAPRGRFPFRPLGLALGGGPSALEVLFASHPMSEERRDTARFEADTTYATALKLPLYRERYMDNTAALRKLRDPLRSKRLRVFADD